MTQRSLPSISVLLVSMLGGATVIMAEQPASKSVVTVAGEHTLFLALTPALALIIALPYVA